MDNTEIIQIFQRQVAAGYRDAYAVPLIHIARKAIA